jgi:hypothetical protein
VTTRTPVRKVRLGPPRRGSEPDEAYKKWIRKFPCILSERFEHRTVRYVLSRIEAAHVGQRGLGQLCPDRECLPLCVWHHTEGPHSHHVLGKKFWAHWRLNRFALIAEFNARYEQATGISRKPIRNEEQQEKKEIA